MQEQSQKDNTSGKVRIADNKVYFDFNNKEIFDIHIDDIVVLGEYTNSDGPFFDDWFLVMVTKDGQWYSIPWYAEDIDNLTNILCNKFQPDLNGSFLTGSTEWASIVRHPEHLKHKLLFKLTPTERFKEPKTFFDKLLSSVGLGNFDTTKYIDLSDEVKVELKNASR